DVLSRSSRAGLSARSAASSERPAPPAETSAFCAPPRREAGSDGAGRPPRAPSISATSSHFLLPDRPLSPICWASDLSSVRRISANAAPCGGVEEVSVEGTGVLAGPGRERGEPPRVEHRSEERTGRPGWPRRPSASAASPRTDRYWGRPARSGWRVPVSHSPFGRSHRDVGPGYTTV